MTQDCDCPLGELRQACQAYFRWESILFRSNVLMSQEELDTAANAFRDARDRILNLIGET